MNYCEFKTAQKPKEVCGSPAIDKYLGLWCCPECRAFFDRMWQKVGELGIPVTARPSKEVPVLVAEEIAKGKVKKEDREFLQSLRIEPL